MNRLFLSAAATTLSFTGLAAPAFAAINIIPDHSTGVTVTGTHGVLRAGSPWGPGSTPSDPFAPVDGTSQPENTQWNNGSFWWDEDPSVNASPVTWVVDLDQVYDIVRFEVQADDNDSYLLEYWDGALWQDAYTVPFSFSFGLVTRDSGTFAPISTDRLRFSAIAGDDYYGLGQLKAYAVPEPTTWALMLFGFAATGFAMRRRRKSGGMATA